MKLNSILSPGRTHNSVPGTSKKRSLEKVAQFICADNPTLNPNQIFDRLIARERLGSTGLGQGIAIPHCRLKSCHEITGCLIKLEKAIDFDAIDGEPVDLLFVLLVPDEAQDEHLAVLARLAELFSDHNFCDQLRHAKNDDELYTTASAY
jgi:PTS system nitrogen regulatory IIA component